MSLPRPTVFDLMPFFIEKSFLVGEWVRYHVRLVGYLVFGGREPA